VEIATGRERDAVPRLEQEHAQLPRPQFGLLHIYHLSSVLRTGCATRDYAWALRVADGDWERFQRSNFRRAGGFAVVLPALHARFLLNRGLSQQQSPAQLAKLVAPDLRALASVDSPLARATCLRTRARLAYLQGDRAGAQRLLEASIPLFDHQNSREEAARDSWACGTLAGGEAGAALKANALEQLRGVGVVDPIRDLASYYPELSLVD